MMASGDNVVGAGDGVETVLMLVGKHRVQVTGDTLSCELEPALFHGPQRDELGRGFGRLQDALLLLKAHGVVEQQGAIAANALDIHSHGLVVDYTGHGFAAVTQIEMYVRESLQAGLPVSPVGERRHLHDSILLFECTLQQQESGQAESPALLVAKPERIAATLIAHGGQGRREVELVHFVVDIQQVIGCLTTI